MPDNDATTDILVKAAAGGDAEALRVLLELHQERIRRAARRGHDRDRPRRPGVSDLVQDTLATGDSPHATPRRNQARSKNGAGWLIPIVARRLSRVRNAPVRLRTARRSRDGGSTDGFPSPLESTAADHGGKPERAISLARLRLALSKLHAGERMVLVMLYLEGLTIRELAAALGIEERAARARHFRAIQQIGRLSRTPRGGEPMSDAEAASVVVPAGSIEVDPELADLAAELAERIQRGELPDVDSLVLEHPGRAEELRRMLASVISLAQLGAEAARAIGTDRGHYGEAVPRPRAFDRMPGNTRESASGPEHDDAGGLETATIDDSTTIGPDDGDGDDDGTGPLSFGRYRALRSLGSGSFGEVFLAEDQKLKRFVAVKVQHLSRLNSFDADGFLHEARLVARLDHPGIVPVYDVGSISSGQCFIVSKYIEGTTLLKRLRERRPTVDESVRILISVGDALQHAHDMGIIHRDLKPSNILISTDDEIFLTDFGVALTATGGGEQPVGLFGTPSYMSPEQARCDSTHVDARSDTFALGILMYELLTGKHPFSMRGSRDEILNRILTEDPVPPRQIDDQIPVEYEQICIKALAKSPGCRYHSPRELADDLRRVRDARRCRVWRIAAIVLAVVLLAGLLAAIWGTSRIQPRPSNDRSVAARILASGGTLRVTTAPKDVIHDLEQLPASFRIGFVDLSRNHALRIDDLRALEVVRSLTSLDLNDTSINDAGLEPVGRIIGLSELWLNQTNVTSLGLKHLEGLGSLIHLDLNGTQVDDDGLASVGKLSQLRYLDVSASRVTDAGLAHLSGLSALRTLRLKDTTITNAGLAHLKNLKSLKQLVVLGTAVTPDALESLHLPASPAP